MDPWGPLLGLHWFNTAKKLDSAFQPERAMVTVSVHHGCVKQINSRRKSRSGAIMRPFVKESMMLKTSKGFYRLFVACGIPQKYCLFCGLHAPFLGACLAVLAKLAKKFI